MANLVALEKRVTSNVLYLQAYWDDNKPILKISIDIILVNGIYTVVISDRDMVTGVILTVVDLFSLDEVKQFLSKALLMYIEDESKIKLVIDNLYVWDNIDVRVLKKLKIPLFEKLGITQNVNSTKKG